MSAWNLPARDPQETNRGSTYLELFFDLVSVVALARATAGLRSGIALGNIADTAIMFVAVFFSIWWAWMNFSWFNTAFGAEDTLSRIATFTQMGGSLILAAGIPAAYTDADFQLVTYGYVIMRAAFIFQWLRVSQHSRQYKTAARGYALGYGICQVLWVVRLYLPDQLGLPVFFLLAFVELAVQFFIERRQRTPWHPQHILERYSLFTIIVLGEAIFSIALGIETAGLSIFMDVSYAIPLFSTALLIFSSWWLYFENPGFFLTSCGNSVFRWAYGHFGIFISLTATGSGLAQFFLSSSVSNSAHAWRFIAYPFALYLLSLWVVRGGGQVRRLRQLILLPISAVSVAVLPGVLGGGIWSIGVIALLCAIGLGQNGPEPVVG